MTSETDQGDPRASDEPEAAAGELARACGLCRAALTGSFFLLRGSAICSACALKLEQRRAGRGQLRRALAFGGMAALLLATLWYLATVATSRPLSGVALLAGIVIGLAVQHGSGGRGGLRYQLGAALLVYAAFVVRFVPPVFGGMADAIKQEHAMVKATPERSRPAASQPEPAGAPSSGTPNPTVGDAADARPSALATLQAYFLFTVVAWGLVLAAPFLPGSLGILPLLSLALAMALAAQLNRRLRLQGPFPG